MATNANSKHHIYFFSRISNNFQSLYLQLEIKKRWRTIFSCLTNFLLLSNIFTCKYLYLYLDRSIHMFFNCKYILIYICINKFELIIWLIKNIIYVHQVLDLSNTKLNSFKQGRLSCLNRKNMITEKNFKK